jgi:hypothetical protein
MKHKKLIEIPPYYVDTLGSSANQMKAYLLSTRARAPSWTPDRLILELFSFTERGRTFFCCSSMVNQVLARHGI